MLETLKNSKYQVAILIILIHASLIIPVLACAFSWLIFFPNEPYILTDFIHLAEVGDEIAAWYDVMLLSWFTFTGFTLAIASLFMMHKIVDAHFNAIAGWIFVSLSISLGGFGVYLGHFLRWNSWDVTSNPMPLAADILDRFIHLQAHPRTIMFMLLFAALFLFIYILTSLLGHMRREQQPA